jgi:hypothetical protein
VTMRKISCAFTVKCGGASHHSVGNGTLRSSCQVNGEGVELAGVATSVIYCIAATTDAELCTPPVQACVSRQGGMPGHPASS